MMGVCDPLGGVLVAGFGRSGLAADFRGFCILRVFFGDRE
jgi:hypothetical protein